MITQLKSFTLENSKNSEFYKLNIKICDSHSNLNSQKLIKYQNIITLIRWLTVIPRIPLAVLRLNIKKDGCLSLWDYEHKLSHNVLVVIIKKLI